MRIEYLAVSQPIYRTSSKANPVRTLVAQKGSIVDLPDDHARRIMKDYPDDWRIVDALPDLKQTSSVDGNTEKEPQKEIPNGGEERTQTGKTRAVRVPPGARRPAAR